MPRALVAYVHAIEAMHTRLGKAMRVGVFVLVGILLIEAISRYIFNNPTIWSVELSGYTFGTYFLIGGGYVLLRGRMVRMDALYARWSPRRKAITDLFTFVFLAVFLISWILGGITVTKSSIGYGQVSSSMWGPPVGPILLITTLAAFLMLLAAVALLIRDIATVRGRPIP